MPKESTQSARNPDSGIGRPRLPQRVHEASRVRRFSRRTEDACVLWLNRLIYFHGKRHPESMGDPEVTAYLNHLAVDCYDAVATLDKLRHSDKHRSAEPCGSSRPAVSPRDAS